MAQPKDGGIYQIVTSSGSFALSGSNAKIVLSTVAAEPSADQVWKLTKKREEDEHVYYNITNTGSGKALTLQYRGLFDDKIPVRLVAAAPGQDWYFESAGEVDGKASFRIYSPLALNLCLPENASGGTEIYTWIRDDTEKSAFHLVET